VRPSPVYERAKINFWADIPDIELKSEAATLVRNAREWCVDVPEVAFFDSNSAILKAEECPGGAEEGDGCRTPEMRLKSLLFSHLERLRLGEQVIKEIAVIGHADPMPPLGTTNDSLASRRAGQIRSLLRKDAQVCDLLMGAADCSRKAIRVETAGARKLIRICPENASKSSQRECNAVNRRVEIRMSVQAKPKEKAKGPSGTG
jgi:hypothetical protein